MQPVADGGSGRGDPRRELAAAYLYALEHGRRLSAHTGASYARDIDQLLALVPGVPLERVGNHAIRRALAQLHARGLSGKSLGRMLSAWRGFFGWLVRHHGLGTNPCAGVRAPKSPKQLPKALSPDAAQQLLERAAEGPLDARDKAVCELAYSSGLRLAELVGLDLADGRAMLRDAEITVTGKGRKRRAVPVGRKACEAIAAWLEVRPRLAKTEEPALFVSERGCRLSPRAVQARVKRWALRAGLGTSLHPHVLRHSFASHVLQSSGDLRAVQEMLGHASIATTQVYTKLDFQHLAKVYDQAHPRARKKT
jgi:integrase/recombinase XerC